MRPEHTLSAEEGFEDLAAALMMGSKFHRMTLIFIGRESRNAQGIPKRIPKIHGQREKGLKKLKKKKVHLSRQREDFCF